MNFELVNCSKEYWDFVRCLRNDQRVNDGFIEKTVITPQMQDIYMNKYSNCYRIALANGIAAGYVGVLDDDIRVCTHPNYQGMGIGKFMINEIVKTWPSAFAKIKINNIASIRLFESCGFTKKYYILTKDNIIS